MAIDTRVITRRASEQVIRHAFETCRRRGKGAPKDGKLREDGRMVHDMYLLQVKAPSESKGAWDYLKLVKTIPGDAAFRPMAPDECTYLKK